MALIRLRRQPSINAPFAGSTMYPTYEDVQNRMSRFFEDALTEPFGNKMFPQVIGWVPATDVVEAANELTITAELPGMELKDIDVSVEEGVLTIRGEKTEEKKEGNEESKMLLYERTYGSFQRSFTLPPTIDATKVTAAFNNGVLKIHMPKSAEVKPKGRKIEVKATK